MTWKSCDRKLKQARCKYFWSEYFGTLQQLQWTWELVLRPISKYDKASYLGDIGIENIELVCYKGPTKIFNIQLSFDLFMLYGFNYLTMSESYIGQ